MSHDQSAKLADKFQKLNNTLFKLTELRFGIREAIALDEVTVPMVGVIAGLAQQALRQSRVDVTFSQPPVENKSVMINHLDADLQQIFGELVQIRNRFLIQQIKTLQKSIVDDIRWLEKYTAVFQPIRDVYAFGNHEQVRLTHTQVISDEIIGHVVGNGLDNQNVSFAAAVVRLLDGVTVGLKKVSDHYLSEWVEAGMDRFGQGKGFVLPRFDGDHRRELYIHTFGCDTIRANVPIGVAEIKHGISEASEGAATVSIKPPYAQELELILVAYSNFIQFAKELNKSPIIMRDYNSLFGVLKSNLMSIDDFSGYLNDIEDTDLAAGVNKIADVVYAQLLTIHLCLSSVKDNLPVVMNYCIREKL